MVVSAGQFAYYFLDEKEALELFFRPFSQLSGSNNPILLVSEIQSLINDHQYVLAEQKSKVLMSHCLEGLRYFQTYDWLFLRSVVTAGYIGWCVFCLEFVIRSFVLGHQSQTSLSIKSCLAVSAAACQYVSIHSRTARLISFPWSSWVVCTPCCGSRKCRQCTMPMSCSPCISGTKSYATIALCLKLYVLVFKMALSSLLLSSLQHLSFWRPWCLASFTVKC